MAIVLLALNGVGMGHLSRLVEISDQLYKTGERPILLHQSQEFPYTDKPFLRMGIQSLQKCDDEYRSRIEDKINCLCRVARPHIFIEDTHPARIQINEHVAKFLIIRPPTFTYISWLKSTYEAYYKEFFIADHPDSPTWPYTKRETHIIQRWEKFTFISPIFRKASDDEIESVQLKYRWDGNTGLFVFSMGGGGHQSGSNDAGYFLQQSALIAKQIKKKHPASRFIFVKGPLFPRDQPIPSEFETVDVETSMPALFAIANGAIIRPGFNSVWECIYAKTPFFYINGTTFSEPIDQKLQRLIDLGLVNNSKFLDPDFQASFRKKCEAISARWKGKPSESFFTRLASAGKKTLKYDRGIVSSAHTKRDKREIDNTLEKMRILPSKKIFWSLDDVVEITEEVDFILSLAKKYSIATSIEVIPYLSKLREEELRGYDKGNKNITVSQHGYSHSLNPANSADIRSEFTFSNTLNENEVDRILKGKQYMTQTFPERYINGFSAPFDRLPGWLMPVLKFYGWEYLIANSYRPTLHLPIVRCHVDVWNWGDNCFKSYRDLLESIYTMSSQYGYAGVILQPQHFKLAASKNLLEDLTARLTSIGFRRHDFLKTIVKP